ncbi:HipA protein, DNA binding regulator [gamma proteobacterium HTCC5015]|nr:HipA protein, DNA binding regulator [gamma proteobacterium HTCC5015]
MAMNGRRVGVLRKAQSGALSFQYDASWLDHEGARAISLSLPLRSSAFKGQSVYAFFDNLLPDVDAIRRRIQARTGAASHQPFDLLAAMGRDCVGAVQLLPLEEWQQWGALPSVQAEAISHTEIASKLNNIKANPFGIEEGEDFRISLAGAQEKMALLRYQGQWHQPKGSTPTSHIIKLPMGYIEHNNMDLSDSCENEWLCSKIAEAYGLPVAASELAQFGRQKTLIVERFDRRWSRDERWLMRLPQEDFCQALGIPSGLKYEADGGPSIQAGMKLLEGSQNANRDRETFFKAQILFWLLAAIDGHGKNFSIFIEPNSAYRMTPLYDIISAYPVMSPSELPSKKAKMAMALTGKNRHYLWHKIQMRHFLSTAKHSGYSEVMAKKHLKDMRDKTPSVIQKVREQLPKDFPKYISDSILNGLEKQARKIQLGDD